MQIFCLFFCVLCELGGKITARNAKVTQSTQVCLSKTSRPLNKSTFYIRLTALRRSGYSFPPTLRFATHWAELTHPSELLQWSQLSVFKQSAISQQSKQFNNSTIKQLNARRASNTRRAVSPFYFSPIPQGWGNLISALVF